MKPKVPRILLIDDSKAFLSGLSTFLPSTEYELFAYTSVSSALADIKTIKPEIIVSDLDMPEMHGFELIQRLRTDHSLINVPILVLTGQKDTEAMSKSILHGADAFCSKDHIQYTIQPQILALLRLKATYEEATRGKQLEAVKALISTYNHEFGNSLAILEGMLRKLGKNHSALAEDTAFGSVQSSVVRIKQTLEKLRNLRHYEEEKYSIEAKILKVS